MPKVNDTYKTQKKTEILEAAYHVFQSKPLYEITMRDIIKETGVSQGGIYLYFSDIDDILATIINQINATTSYKEQVDIILQNSTSLEDTIQHLFAFLGNYMNENYTTLGKIQFELTVLFTNHPERQAKLLPMLSQQQSGQYLMEQLFGAIAQGISTHHFTPIVSLQDIILFIHSSIEGIVKNVVLQRCYQLIPEEQMVYDPITLMNTLSKSVLLMLTECNQEA